MIDNNNDNNNNNYNSFIKIRGRKPIKNKKNDIFYNKKESNKIIIIQKEILLIFD